MATLETWTLHVQLLRLPEINSEVLLKDVKAALWTIPNATVIESSRLIYTAAAAAVITEMLGYMMNNHKEQYSSLRKASSRQHRGNLATIGTAKRGT